MLRAAAGPEDAASGAMRMLSVAAWWRVRTTWSLEEIGGEEVRDNMTLACHFADADPYRAVTRNKGIMNGASAVVLATGNDTRAIEAGDHACAARDGYYRSMSRRRTPTATSSASSRCR